ncbi:MAG: DUF58 domain-containing protein, partial [Chloroflexota bacterium]
MKTTGRFNTFVFTAFLLYLAANQTQVNWLYVTSALIAGVIPVAFFANRSALRGLALSRTVTKPDGTDNIHEADEVTVTLGASATKRPLAQITLTETCPLADPETDLHTQKLFVPRLPRRAPLDAPYTVEVYQRGVPRFPVVTATTRAPFGLFARRRTFPVMTDVLVYPEVRPLDALDLLDRQPAAQITGTRAGVGTEVIGVRGYQQGDSPRHIHWRSVARTGRLVSKEFAEETQPGVSLVFDRYQPNAN